MKGLAMAFGAALLAGVFALTAGQAVGGEVSAVNPTSLSDVGSFKVGVAVVESGGNWYYYLNNSLTNFPDGGYITLTDNDGITISNDTANSTVGFLSQKDDLDLYMNDNPIKDVEINNIYIFIFVLVRFYSSIRHEILLGATAPVASLHLSLCTRLDIFHGQGGSALKGLCLS